MRRFKGVFAWPQHVGFMGPSPIAARVGIAEVRRVVDRAERGHGRNGGDRSGILDHVHGEGASRRDEERREKNL